MSSSQQAADNLTMNRLRKPAIDPERIVIEPALCVMHNSITPFTRISAGVYDFANRRWYELNVEQEIEDEQWIERKVRQYIDSAVHPFNVISIDKHGDVTLELKDNGDVDRPIIGAVEYHGPLPTTSLALISKRKHLSGRVDTCQWEGRTCAYKCIDFKEDIERMQREIRIRETIWEKLGDHNGVAPILAVVVEPSRQFIDGILLPSYRSTLESHANDDASAITLKSLHRFIKTLTELHQIGIIHGDICERNIAVSIIHEYPISEYELVLFDFGEVAPRYEGDVKAAGKLLLWCLEQFTWTQYEKETIKDAASALLREDTRLCLQILKRESVECVEDIVEERS
jgi:serine/threonine protein kinase